MVDGLSLVKKLIASFNKIPFFCDTSFVVPCELIFFKHFYIKLNYDWIISLIKFLRKNVQQFNKLMFFVFVGKKISNLKI